MPARRCVPALHNRCSVAIESSAAMIYKFRSSATGELIMLGPQGDRMLRLIGREPASQGIIEPAAMAGAIDALLAAIATDEVPPEDDDARAPPVGLRQRLWPMIEMLRRARAADAAVVWGV